MTKEKYAWTGLGVPLTWLVELDNVPVPHALPDAFGDRYLCKYNPVYASIRVAALRLGYRFSAEDTPLWRDYQALSLVSLHRILAHRIIPYFDTSNALKRLIETYPKLRLPPGFITSNLKHNHAFHESAHCVASSVLSGMQAELTAVAPDEKDRFVLEAIFAESFANTVESLGSIIRNMQISDTVFYPLNSYLLPDQKREEALVGAARDSSPALRFTLLFLSYVEANLAAEAAADATLQRIAGAAGCTSDQLDLVGTVAESAFCLNTGFRENTTPAYFELLGYAQEYRSLAQADWLSGEHNRAVAREIARRFREAAGCC